MTGTAEGYAYKAKKMLRPLEVDVKGCEKVKPSDLAKEFVANGGKYSALLIITSTFGEGHPPTNVIEFFDAVRALPDEAMKCIKFAVMAIGSRVYPDFCQAGIGIDNWLSKKGGERFLPLKKGDELNDQAGSVVQWIGMVGASFQIEQKKALVQSGDTGMVEIEEEGPPVLVEVLSDNDSRVKEAQAEERKIEAATASAASYLGASYMMTTDSAK